MNAMEVPQKGRRVPEKSPAEIEERAKLIEEVHRRYHKKLLEWCEYKLFHKRAGSENIEVDAEDIVQEVYRTLLNAEKPIDLSQNEHAIKVYLNIALDHRVTLFRLRKRMVTRNPEGGLVSLDEMQGAPGGEDESFLGKKRIDFKDGQIHQTEIEDEEDLDPSIKKHFAEEPEEEDYSERAELIPKVPGAMEALEKFDPRGAKILRQRHEEGKKLEEIGQELGVTRERVRQLEERAHGRIKFFLENGKFSSHDYKIPAAEKKPFTEEEDAFILTNRYKDHLTEEVNKKFHSGVKYRTSAEIIARHGELRRNVRNKEQEERKARTAITLKEAEAKRLEKIKERQERKERKKSTPHIKKEGYKLSDEEGERVASLLQLSPLLRTNRPMSPEIITAILNEEFHEGLDVIPISLVREKLKEIISPLE